MAVIGTKIYLFGGWTGSEVSIYICMYIPTECDRWTYIYKYIYIYIYIYKHIFIYIYISVYIYIYIYIYEYIYSGPLVQAAMAAIGTKIYLFGGWTGSEVSIYICIYVYAYIYIDTLLDIHI